MKERDLYNPDTVDTVGLDSPSNRRRLNFSDIGKYLPRKLVRYAAPAAMAVSAAVYGGAVCGEEESHDDGVLGVSSGQRFNPEAFLKVPTPRDPDAQVVQGWKYNAVIRGTRSHFAIDYVLGVDINDADTWNPFPVLAAAQGVGCVGHYTDSEHGEGNYVQLLHPNGYRTRYLHNEESSLSDRPYPDCSRPSKEWLPLRQGDKLSEAGDAGTEEDWTHLHWEVFDPAGNKVDPYDLYSTRTEYPDPNFLNGKKCGQKTLIVNCPIDTSNAELASTMAPRPTMEPFDAYTVSPPMEPIAAYTVSPPFDAYTVSPPMERFGSQEFSPEGGGVISVLGWEFRINSWGYEPDYDYGPVSILHDGWKRVVVVGDLVNPTNRAMGTGDIVRYFNTYEAYKFKIEGNGWAYEADVGRRDGYTSRSWNPMSGLENVDVPGGLSVPFVIIAEVPNNVVDYSMRLFDARTGEGLSSPVEKGEVYRPREGSRREGVSTEREICDVNGYASIKYAGDALFGATTIANGSFQEQYLMFDITNQYGVDIPVNYGWGGIRASVFTASKGIRLGSQYYYSKDFTNPQKIAPGLEKRVYVPVGSDGGDEMVDNKLVNMDGAVVSLTIWDGNDRERNCSWQLP